MFLLLRQLQQLRARVGLGRPVVGSCALRHVDAGSCNGCEHELNAVAGPHYDLQRFGLNIVASPRHADVLLITGPVTTRMRVPLLRAYAAMPEPRLVAALGNCALGVNIVGLDDEHMGGVAAVLPVDIQIPGVPADPGTDRGAPPRGTGARSTGVQPRLNTCRRGAVHIAARHATSDPDGRGGGTRRGPS